MSPETLMRTESVRVPKYRASYGSCIDLAQSITTEGMRRPITVWKDGTLISGGRRWFAHVLDERPRIPVVFVDTIEDAAKRMLADNQDDYLAIPWKWSEVCRLWQVMRRLDAPAAAKRLDEARRRGVELRRQTQAGKRKPGRATNHSEDYALCVLAEPFGISAATARRIELPFQTANGTVEASAEKRALAAEIMQDLDNGASIWGGYQRLMGHDPHPRHPRPKPLPPVEPVPAKQQTAAWDKSLPQLEGLVSGLVELGPPNPELTWDQVGPVRTRLTVVRRALEQMIKQMKEMDQS